MKIILFYYFKMIIGGSETLILRLIKWYADKGYRIILMNESFTDDKSLLVDIESISGLEYYSYNKLKHTFSDINNVELEFEENDNVYINTLQLWDFFRCIRFFFNCKYSCRFFYSIYIVHPFCTLMNRVISFVIGKQIVISLIKGEHIVFMDEQTVASTAVYYNIKKTINQMRIIRLPIFIRNKKDSIDISNFNILSITRFDFPFKGYVLGLIDDYVCLNKEYRNTSLTIIGTGEGKNIVLDKVHELPEAIQRNISIIDSVPYSQIESYIKEASVYVGMGTTVLDAANYNRICIIATPYQLSNLSNGFFHTNCFAIAEMYNGKREYETFYDLLSYLLKINFQIFEKESLESKKKLEKFYNIDNIAPFFTRESLKEFSFTLKCLTVVGAYMHLVLDKCRFLRNYFK